MSTRRDWIVAQLQRFQTATTRGLNKGICRCREVIADKKGQGTTEYAILVGVLVVIAIVAVLAFKDKLQGLWEAISDGINGL